MIRRYSFKSVLTSALTAILFLPFTGTSDAQIVLSEVGYATVDFGGQSKWVELHNTGSGIADASGLFLCRWPAYSQVSSLSVLSGDVNIPAGGYLVVAFTSLETGDGELGLYTNNSFDSAASIRDYVEYGSTGHQRSGRAVEAGVWVTGDSVPPSQANQSLSDLGTGVGASAWASTPPTPGAKNAGSVGTETIDFPERALRVFSVFPNPVSRGLLTVQYHVSETSPVDLEVFDLLGRQRIKTSAFATASANALAIEINVDALPPGNYLYRLSSLADGSQRRVSGSFVKQSQ